MTEAEKAALGLMIEKRTQSRQSSEGLLTIRVAMMN